MRLNEKGQEVHDGIPVEIPLGMRRPETLNEMVARLIRNQASRAAAEAGMETFEEANDFEIEEDSAELMATRYEEMADEEPIARVPAGSAAPAPPPDTKPAPSEVKPSEPAATPPPAAS